MKVIHHITLVILLLATGNLAGQDMVHKASRADERSFGKGVSRVSVYSEKASVTVKGWSGSEIKVLLKPVSRNTDMEKAVADLKFIRYYAEKEGDRLVIRNSFTGKMEQITSNLSISIEIYMPVSIPAEITNLYGPVIVSNLSEATVAVSFGSLAVTDIGSKCNITARYSNMELTSVHGALAVRSEKSDIRALRLSAASTLDCSYGTANLELSGPGPLTVKGHRTTVELTVDDFGRYRYILEAQQGKVILPDGRQEGKEKVVIQNTDNAGIIDVTTSYCDIRVSTK